MQEVLLCCLRARTKTGESKHTHGLLLNVFNEHCFQEHWQERKVVSMHFFKHELCVQFLTSVVNGNSIDS